MKTVVLSGGVGGARFLSGLVAVADERELVAVVNTGDDSEFYGLYVAPDIDSIVYTLAGAVNEKNGWGLAGDSFHTLKELKSLGCEAWFQLGDRDLATHIFRTMLLRGGHTLTQATKRLAAARGLTLSLLPMSDDRVETVFDTAQGVLPFQEYMVKHGCNVPVKNIRFLGAEKARPAPGVLEAIAQAEQIIVAPSNPYISIGTILAVPGIRRALAMAPGTVIAISPIVGGNAIKGPAARLLREFGKPVSPIGVAGLYADFLDIMVVDERDADTLPALTALGIGAIAAQTMMTSAAARQALAAAVLALPHRKRVPPARTGEHARE